MPRGNGHIAEAGEATDILYGSVGSRRAAPAVPSIQTKKPSLHLGKLQARTLEAVANVRGASNANALFDTLWVLYHDEAKAKRIVKSLEKRGFIYGPPAPKNHHPRYVGRTWWLTALGEEALDAHRARQSV